ncbi:type IV secretory system conjugative DNA transfer family protein [Caulobacter sp. S45]|uniref:type IV secretory system conjugative DNA transfer family protein n=1 Tax=Caulobacter sp. S45 TaxID=1641861 RepID=UPI00131E8671|nr:type IV secretory system conjugative DNA transfer family protein [Caulobacter sp. S45]
MAAKPARVLIGAAALLLVAGIVATQTVAARFHYPIEFGGGLIDVARQRIYAPWSFLVWYGRYQKAYSHAFDGAALAGFAVIALPCLVLIARSRRSRPTPSAFGQGAWAQLADVRRAGFIRPDGAPAGRVLGRFEGKLLTYQGVEHGIIVAPSRSGKGAGHVVPTACAWAQSAMIYDRKGELWHITADHRRRFSHTFYFAPTDPDTARWNPLFEVRKGPLEIADIQNLVGILVDPLGAKQGALDFWDKSAKAFFVAVILHVLYSAPDDKKNLTHVRQLLMNIEPTLDAMLSTQHRYKPDLSAPGVLEHDARGEPIPEVHPEVWMGATAFRGMDDRVSSNVLSTAQTALELFADPLVARATSWSDFCLGDLVCAEAPVSFYLITPQAHADRLAFLVRVMLRATFNSLMEDAHLDSRGRAKKHHLLLLLDEFPKLGALPFIENGLGEMAGYGLTAHLVCQSFNDVYKAYGQNTSLFDNMHVTCCFATSEPNSIRGIVTRAGRATEMRESFSAPSTIFGRAHYSRSLSEQRREILSENDVRELPATQQLLFVNNTKPILADKLRYYEDPWFKTVTTDYFHGKRASVRQTPEALDVPARPPIDWIGVRPVGAVVRAATAADAAGAEAPDDGAFQAALRPLDDGGLTMGRI